jgi:hypothetical protein
MARSCPSLPAAFDRLWPLTAGSSNPSYVQSAPTPGLGVGPFLWGTGTTETETGLPTPDTVVSPRRHLLEQKLSPCRQPMTVVLRT